MSTARALQGTVPRCVPLQWFETILVLRLVVPRSDGFHTCSAARCNCRLLRVRRRPSGSDIEHFPGTCCRGLFAPVVWSFGPVTVFFCPSPAFVAHARHVAGGLASRTRGTLLVKIATMAATAAPQPQTVDEIRSRLAEVRELEKNQDASLRALLEKR